MDRRLFKGFAMAPRRDGGLAEMQQTLAAVQCEADELRRRDGERADEWKAARQLFITMQSALTSCHDAVLRLADQAAPKPLRLAAELAISGLIAVGKQTRATDCAGLKPGDLIVVTPKVDVPAPLIIGSTRCAVADRLRVDIGALVVITLGTTAIPLDVLVFRE